VHSVGTILRQLLPVAAAATARRKHTFSVKAWTKDQALDQEAYNMPMPRLWISQTEPRDCTPPCLVWVTSRTHLDVEERRKQQLHLADMHLNS
jgi:hypothetical protein